MRVRPVAFVAFVISYLSMACVLWMTADFGSLGWLAVALASLGALFDGWVMLPRSWWLEPLPEFAAAAPLQATDERRARAERWRRRAVELRTRALLIVVVVSVLTAFAASLVKSEFLDLPTTWKVITGIGIMAAYAAGVVVFLAATILDSLVEFVVQPVQEHYPVFTFAGRSLKVVGAILIITGAILGVIAVAT